MEPVWYELDECDAELRSEANQDPNRLDLPPEFCQYRDEGCDLARSCLDCPFPYCVYELAGGRQRWLKKRRDSEINRLFADECKEVKELAKMYGISRRTVQRALKGAVKTAPESRINISPEGDLSGNE